MAVRRRLASRLLDSLVPDLSPDHIGGHIKGSMHVPSASLDAMLPTLVRTLEDKDVVVFHCALSQQRGPGAALRYLRARSAKAQANTDKSTGGSSGVVDAQKVYVLDRGFAGWQEIYGEDERLTEGYVKDLWKDGYS